MAHVIAEEQFPKMPSEQELEQIGRKMDAALGKRGAKWKRTYLAEDIKREICEFEAPNAEAVRAAYEEIGVPFERVYEAKVADEGRPEWH